MGLWTGCTREKGVVPTPPTPEGEVSVRFNLDMPTLASRALLESDEEQVETIDILAFTKEGSDYRYSYRRDGKNYANKSFTVDLISYSQEQILVVLVNAKEELAKASITLTDNVEQALSKIILESPDPWAAKNDIPETFRPLPMTGITDATTITPTMTVFPGTLTLTRALTRINVTLKQDDPDQTNGVHNFELQTVHVFNRATKGYVGYKAENWNNKLAWVPADPEKVTDAAFSYAADGSGITSNVTNKIYILESKGVTLANHLESTAIVVGGIYTPESGAPQTCYYRIDLTPNGLLGTSAVDIVRNYSYDIEIQSVTYAGPDNPTDAYEGLVTLSATVQSWKSNQSGIIVDGDYYLKLSQPTISIGDKGKTITIRAWTNYDANPNMGFLPGVTLNTGGLSEGWSRATISGNKGSGSTYIYDIDVEVDTLPDGFSADSRWAAFKIKAGNMAHQMEIYQWNKTWLKTSTIQNSYAPGPNRYTITLTTAQWQRWKLTVDDPDNILFNRELLHNLTGGGGGSDGVQDYLLAFYIRANAAAGKTATLTFTNTTADNNPLVIKIKTP